MEQIESASGFNFTQNITVPDFAAQLQEILGESVNISAFLDTVIGTFPPLSFLWVAKSILESNLAACVLWYQLISICASCKNWSPNINYDSLRTAKMNYSSLRTGIYFRSMRRNQFAHPAQAAGFRFSLIFLYLLLFTGPGSYNLQKSVLYPDKIFDFLFTNIKNQLVINSSFVGKCLPLIFIFSYKFADFV